MSQWKHHLYTMWLTDESVEISPQLVYNQLPKQIKRTRKPRSLRMQTAGKAMCRAFARGECNDTDCKFAHGESDPRSKVHGSLLVGSHTLGVHPTH
jgi:hypothetical protein